MNHIDRNFLNKLFKEYSNLMVGRLCKQIECLQDDLDKNSKEFKYLNHAKKLRKEFIYQTFRDMKNQIAFHAEGREYINYKIYTPPDNH